MFMWKNEAIGLKFKKNEVKEETSVLIKEEPSDDTEWDEDAAEADEDTLEDDW